MPEATTARSAKQAQRTAKPIPMGRLEREVFQRESSAWRRLRKRADGAAVERWAIIGSATGFGAFRAPTARDPDDDVPSANLDGPHAVAAKLMLAKAIDSVAGLAILIREGAPVVTVDVPDPATLSLVERGWKEVVFGDDEAPSVAVDSELRLRQRADVRSIHLFVTEPATTPKRESRRQAALTAVSFGPPLFAFSPSGMTHLPDAIMRSCDAKLCLGPPDADTVAKTIRIVTGEKPQETLEPALSAKIGIEEIAIAIRFDRTAAECVDRLRRLALQRSANKDSRELRLDEMHGMDAAVAWAKSFVKDVAAWRRGALPWSAIDAGVVWVGPPGTGKTTLAKVVSVESGLNLTVASLGHWQGSGDGHLGHLLREMTRDFNSAANGILFVDELDSLGDRNSMSGPWARYSIEIVNRFIELCDGISGSGTQGGSVASPARKCVLIGATNNASRIDPAIVRSGRFNRIIRIDLPDATALEKMLRVRLRGDLADADLSDVALAATGCSGADVERIVKDSYRAARHGGRTISLDDLKRAVSGDAAVPPELLPRVAVHEAGHILVDVLLFGAEGVVATMTPANGRAAASFRLVAPPDAGTYDDHFRRLQVLFAGRAAEKARFDDSSDGWAGAAGSDLEQATGMAVAMVGSLGMAGDFPLYLGPRRAASGLLAFPEVRARARRILKGAETAAARLIARHRAALDEVAARLLADGRIDGADVARIVAGRRGRRPAQTSPKRLRTPTQKGFA